jgi:UDP-N-acetylglucosamine acyltransferase
MASNFHPTALISAEAVIGEDVEIGPYCRIVGNARIGDGCVLQSQVLIDQNTILGARNFVGHGCVLGTPPQDKKWDSRSESWLQIGDDNTFREYVTANRATGTGQTTRIGSRCMLMANSHIAHNCFVGDEVIMANVATLAGHVQIHDWCVIGGVIALHQHTRIGKGAFLGGFSAMRQDLPPFFRAAGNPGCTVGVNLVGMQRRGLSHATVRAVRAAYKILYLSRLKLDEALKGLRGEFSAVEEVQAIVRFVEESKNGISRPRSQGSDETPGPDGH